MSENNSVDLFLDHTHTDSSNQYLEDIQGIDELAGNNHYSDYLAIREQVPEDINLIFNRTEHHATDRSFYYDLREEILEQGGTFYVFHKHVYWELDGKKAAIINSVEASFEEPDTHVLLSGVPIEDKEYYCLSEDELYEEARDAEWIAPAHPFLPYSNFYDHIDGFLDRAEEGEFQPALGYTTGYSPTWNLLARGEIQKHVPDFLYTLLEKIGSAFFSDEMGEIVRDQRPIERSIYDVIHEAEQRDIDLAVTPELDLHVVVPEKLEGAGVLKQSAMKDLGEGRLPTDKLLDTEVLRYSDQMAGITFRQLAQTIPDRMPGYKKQFWKDLPYTEAEFRHIHEESLAGLEDMSVEEILENTCDPRINLIEENSSYPDFLFNNYYNALKDLLSSLTSKFV